jgi:hypothetical protein
LALRSIEKPVILERFISIIPGPYWLSALIWATTVSSGLGFDAISFIATGTSPLSLATLPNTLLNLLFFFYAFLMVRYIRKRVVAEEAHIAPRLTDEAYDYHRTFGRMTRTLPPLLIALALSAMLLYSYAINGVFSSTWVIFANIIVVFLGTFSAATYIWEFGSVSWGLHKLGGTSLKLGSFLEDRMMGTKPLGNLALSLTIAYFGEILIATLLFATIPGFNIGSIVIFTSFLLFGVGLFFLPLNSIHVRMQQEKRKLVREIGARYPRLRQDPSQRSTNATLEDVHAGVIRLTDLQEVEMLDRKISALPTWPFDVNVVSKFVAIVVSVTAVLLTRLITTYLIRI